MTDVMDGPGRDPMFGRPASTPYAGGTGSTGSAASHERREHEDEHGVSAFRQEQILGALRAAGTTGLTWSELGDRMGWHHGQSTGALSVLHKEGEIVALADRRKRSTIYVLREFVAGRTTRDPGQTRGNRMLEDANAVLNQENGALNQRVTDLQATVAERDAMLQQSERQARIAFAERDEFARRVAIAEQQTALAVEQANRADEERGRREEELTRLRRERAEGLLDNSVLERENQAMRTVRALTQLDEPERETWNRVGDVLQANSTLEDEQPVRVRLGTVRTMWTALARQVAAEPQTRARPGLPAPAATAAPTPAADPEN